jgi:DNA-binding response OmpR family regulator
MCTEKKNTPNRSVRILLAEDDEELRFILARSLRRASHDVEEIGDIAALFQRLAAFSAEMRGPLTPTILVSDVYMPGGNALDVVERLRTTLRGLPIVFITSAYDTRIAEKGLALGARAVLEKPVDMDELKALIKAIIEGTPTTPCVKPPHVAT